MISIFFNLLRLFYDPPCDLSLRMCHELLRRLIIQLLFDEMFQRYLSGSVLPVHNSPLILYANNHSISESGALYALLLLSQNRSLFRCIPICFICILNTTHTYLYKYFIVEVYSDIIPFLVQLLNIVSLKGVFEKEIREIDILILPYTSQVTVISRT